jgi:hypothetical protein
MMASGVRSSWAALAVNSRCTAKPFASRSSAWLMEWTSGMISVGRFRSGNRTDVASGPIDAAIRETSRTGLSPLRMAKMPIANVASMSSGLTQTA